MKICNSKDSYGLVSIALHWLMGFVAIGLYFLGLYIDDLTYYDSAYQWAPQLHISLGMILGGFLVFRILWNSINKTPEPISKSKIIRFLGKLAHIMLYSLLILLVISGYLIETEKGVGVSVFDWFTLPALPFIIPNQKDIADEIHEVSADVLIYLTAFHILATLKHHYFDKDNTLKRMLGK